MAQPDVATDVTADDLPVSLRDAEPATGMTVEHEDGRVSTVTAVDPRTITIENDASGKRLTVPDAQYELYRVIELPASEEPDEPRSAFRCHRVDVAGQLTVEVRGVLVVADQTDADVRSIAEERVLEEAQAQLSLSGPGVDDGSGLGGIFENAEVFFSAPQVEKRNRPAGEPHQAYFAADKALVTLSLDTGNYVSRAAETEDSQEDYYGL